MNGFLEISEYITCLKTGTATINMQEIITLALAADINGDQRIDFEELMLYFHEILRMIRFQTMLQEVYITYKMAPKVSGNNNLGIGSANGK